MAGLRGTDKNSYKTQLCACSKMHKKINNKSGEMTEWCAWIITSRLRMTMWQHVWMYKILDSLSVTRLIYFFSFVSSWLEWRQWLEMKIFWVSCWIISCDNVKRVRYSIRYFFWCREQNKRKKKHFCGCSSIIFHEHVSNEWMRSKNILLIR